MKIASDSPKYVAPTGSATKKSSSQGGADTQKVAQQSDAFDVHLSSAVEQMKTISGTGDDIRMAKVEAIKEQLAAGTYNISGKDVANKILGVLRG